jgi:septum formation protein
LKNFIVKSSDFDEQSLDKKSFTHPYEYVLKNAECKATTVFHDLRKQGIKFDLIIGADSIVSLGDQILEKPKDEQDAQRMLRQLSGQTNTVYSGVAILYNQGTDTPHVTAFYEATSVEFSTLSDDFIDAYIKSGEPMDKAGSYGIQGLGGGMVERINGCFFNVMGLPLNHLCRVLSEHPFTNTLRHSS